MVQLTHAVGAVLPQEVDILAVALLLVSTLASSALFAYRNRNVRKEIESIFKLPDGKSVIRVKERVIQLVISTVKANFACRTQKHAVVEN